MGTRLHPITAAIAIALGTAALWPTAQAADPTKEDEVVVTAKAIQDEADVSKEERQTDDFSSLDSEEISTLRVTTSDSAGLLRDIPGVSIYAAGGVSSLPSMDWRMIACAPRLTAWTSSPVART